MFLGNTQQALERNVFRPMRNIWGEQLVGNIRRGTNTINLFGVEAYALGADKVTSATKIQGQGIEYCYGDEVSTWAKEVFDMLKSRLDKPNSRFDGTCNPAGPDHWLKKFLDSGADIYHQHYTIDDNPFLPAKFVADLKAEYAGTVLYDRFILGRWVRAEGAIYQSFNEQDHTLEPHQIPKIKRIAFGVDVGHSNATVFLAIGTGFDGRAYILDEYYHSGRHDHKTLSPSKYADAFIKFQDKVIAAYELRDQHGHIVHTPKYAGVYIDPSATGFMEQLREVGAFSIYKAIHDVLPGIQTVASVIDNDRLRVSKRCRHTIDEFHGYCWDEKAADIGDDKPIKADDHCMDALRYYFHSRQTEWRGRRVA